MEMSTSASTASANAKAKAKANADANASPVETILNDQLADFLGPISDIATLWRVHDVVVKRIRAVEKATRGKPKKERDPDAPKKTAGPQLLAWNAQVARVQALSAEASKGMLTYNHAKAVASIMKAAGLLVVKKEASVLPTDAEIFKAVEGYYKSHNPALAADKAKANIPAKSTSKKIKEEPKSESDDESDDESAKKMKTKTKEHAKTKEQSKGKPKAAPEPTVMDMTPYDYIIDGKSYERIDANGYAFIWDAKGKYMGVYNEKKKAFDTSVPDPTM
jgi:hypothetical protein